MGSLVCQGCYAVLFRSSSVALLKELMIFHNFESVKLHIINPDFWNIAILILLGLVFLFPRRSVVTHRFLDQGHTNQLKGIAIVSVILGHLWVHVSDSSPSVRFAGDAVALFLMLSGYGLSVSNMKTQPDLRTYFSHRILRVMIPYWIVTPVFILLDYVLLDRIYSLNDIFLTVFGINISLETKLIDYIRWYITFQLFWYVVFYLIVSHAKGPRYLFALYICSLILLPVDYYFTQWGWYQFFAFPLGCTIGYYHERVATIVFQQKKWLPFIGLSIFAYVILYKIWIGSLFQQYTSSIVFKLINETTSILFCIAVIFCTGSWVLRGYISSFFEMCGDLSYEMFLLNGPFLIKYNPIMDSSDHVNILVSFSLFLVFLMMVSFIFHRGIKNVYKGVLNKLGL